MFADRAWTRGLPGMELQAYVSRSAVIGGVPKVNAVFRQAEADFIIIPEKVISRVKFLAPRLPPAPESGLDTATLCRTSPRSSVRAGGFGKGRKRWGPMYRRAVAEVTDPHLEDAAVVRLAEGFVCDYVWVLRKLDRGEIRTVQRTLHQELAGSEFSAPARAEAPPGRTHVHQGPADRAHRHAGGIGGDHGGGPARIRLP